MAKVGRYDLPTLVPTIEGVVWSLAPLAIIVVSLRFYAKIRILHHVGWDDYLMLLAIVSATAKSFNSELISRKQVLMLKNSCFVQVAIHYGLGRHIDVLLQEDAIKAIKWDYLAQPSSIMAPTFGRISFILTIMSLIGHSRTRRIILW